MFANLAEKLQETLRRLRGKGKLNEKDVETALREIRLALLEADVNFKVVKEFVAQIRERAVGQVPDASPEEALAFFVRRFESLQVEVDLLAARVRAGTTSPPASRWSRLCMKS